MMSEKIFILCQDDLGNYEIRYDDKIFHFLWEVAPILNEQQATIRKLQDLCGESDSENAKLRIENEQLRRLFVEMKQPITINLTEEEEKELRKLLGLIDDE